ncbi:adhesin [uncultured Rothia sp.]|uniref:adhesin n=1 Tax=uncultured Rothia sp. TaxID=316088 RepID=UPI0028DCD67C|nr:adhesin [uncultured Rothia sp.]
MPEPAHSKTRATAAIAASVLSVTGVGAAHAGVQVQNTGGLASSTTVEPDNPPSAANVTSIENVATQNSPQVYVEQGVVINPARSQSITVTGEGFTGGPVERYGVAVYVSEYRQYPLYALARGSAVAMTLVPELDVDGGRFSTQLTLPAGTLDPNQQYVVATAVVDPGKGYATEDASYNSSAPLELLPADTQDEPLSVQILSGQMEIPQDKNLVVYKVTGLGGAQAFEIVTYVYALDTQGNRILLAASPARADVVNGTLLDGIEVEGRRLEEVQSAQDNLRYVLSVEVAPSAANGYTAQEVEVPFMNGWNVQNGSAPVATAERAMAEQEQLKQFEEDAQPEQNAQAESVYAESGQAESDQTASSAQSEQAIAVSPVDQFDYVLPEDDPRRHYDLPRNTVFDRVHDTTEEQNNTSNPVMTARLHVEETVVPENDSEKALTVRGEGFEGVGTVHLMVSTVDEYGAATGGIIASADVSEIDSTGAFTAQVQIPGSALKPGTTYRVSAVAEDEQGTVRMVNGGFTVERDSVDNAPAAPEVSESESSAPEVNAPEATVPAEAAAPAEATAPAADQPKAGESATEQKDDTSVAVQNTGAQDTPAQKGSGQKAEAKASDDQKVAAGAQQKREQLAATGASNMLVISAAGSLSLLAGMRLSRRRRSEMQLSSRH